jgi:signal transduction histidine kinase
MNEDIAIGIIISLFFISLVILFCAILIKLYIQKIKKYNAQIYENEITFQKTLNASILETQEQLLDSISQDLHDDAGQQLTVINFQLENLKLDFPDCENNLKPVSESVGKLSQSLRQISHSLNSNWLDKNGLIGAIHLEIERIKKNKLIEVTFEKENFTKKFRHEEQIVIFRIFQEVINNSLKYSKASKIEVKIGNKPKFNIAIIDNGIGFDVAKLASNTNSIGIQNCIKRAKIINYSFHILSQINNGTQVTIQEN